MTDITSNLSFNLLEVENTKEPVFLCVDISGSVENVKNYHEVKKNIFNLLENTNLTIILWDNKFHIYSKEYYSTINTNNYKSYNKNQHNVYDNAGYGGTLTSAIARGLSTFTDYKNCHIVVLTDGCVEMNDISLCETIFQEFLKKNSMKSFTSFISNNFNSNCSVFAPFIRGDWTSNIYSYNFVNQSPLKILKVDLEERKKLMDIVKNASTEQEINDIYSNLVEYLTSMTMGKKDGNPEIRSIILDMFKRIQNNIKDNLSKNDVVKNVENEFFETKDISLNSMKNLITYYKSSFNGSEFQHKINFLLKMCDGQLADIFNPQDIRNQSLNRSTNITSAPTVENLNTIVADENVQPIHCPITLDDEKNMVIMIKQLQPLFNIIDKGMQDAIISNTFSAVYLNDKIKDYLDHAVSLEAYLMNESKLSPFTRVPISSCIVLGSDDVSVKATNYAIGQMLLGKNGIIGNPDVWFYVLYNCIKSGNAPWLEETLPMFESQLLYRMNHSKCTISMSGHAFHTQLKTKFGVALRFTLSQPEIDMPKEESSFPNFSGSTKHIINLLNMYGCVLPDKLLKYCNVVSILAQLVSDCKKLHIDGFKTKYRALIGNFYHVKQEDLSPIIFEKSVQNKWFVEYVPCDGDQQTLPDFAKNMTQDEINLRYNLSKLIQNESVTTFTIIDNNIKYDSIEQFFRIPDKLQNDWKLYNYPLTNKASHTPICPKTLRPYTYENSKHWTDKFVEMYNSDNHFNGEIFSNDSDKRPSREVFSGNNMYGEFINIYKFHPTLSDFVLFCYNRVLNSKHKHTTIPNISFCDGVIQEYAFSRQLPIDEFIRLHTNSRNRVSRVLIEKS
jgi:hypothetical protein